ncbi:MAG: hypothetical protein JW715_02710 [Sedimentisphaerales bacterium]|nr:hypothetical protein [Sedimentisphaerales bacterium]
MNEIVRAVLLSFFKDMSIKTKVLLAGFAAVLIILSGILIFQNRAQSPSSTLPQRIATLSSLSITDANGLAWSLEPVRGQPLASINQSGKKPGPPLLIKTNTINISNQTISIGLTLEGRAGEKYIAGATKGKSRQPEPIFRILDENGKTLATGKFEYG